MSIHLVIFSPENANCLTVALKYTRTARERRGPRQLYRQPCAGRCPALTSHTVQCQRVSTWCLHSLQV